MPQLLPTCAVRSYRTFSALPVIPKKVLIGGLFSVALFSGLPRPGFPRRLVSVMPGLSSYYKISSYPVLRNHSGSTTILP